LLAHDNPAFPLHVMTTRFRASPFDFSDSVYDVSIKEGEQLAGGHAGSG